MINPRFMNDFCQETKDWSDGYIGANNKFPVMDIDDRLRAVEKRLLIIAPSDDILAKYPALAEAYREYKIIERLVLGNDQT
jgi:hypothetical protein